jgi:hypothetical protein
MSFDLAVMHVEEPINEERAVKIYHALCEGDYEVLPPGENVERFYQELTAQYPDLDQLSDDEAEDSPWSDSLDVSDGAVVMCIRWSRADDMAAFVKGLAAKHGLACYDPQEDVMHLPPSLFS